MGHSAHQTRLRVAGRRPGPGVALAAGTVVLALWAGCRSGDHGPTAPPVSTERCVPGSPGCICENGTQCQDGTPCYYGTCIGEGAARPEGYYYSQQNLDDEMIVNRLILEKVTIAPGSRVADIGAGAGFYSMHAARLVGPAGRVYATDIDQGRLDSIAQMFARLPDGAELAPRVELRRVTEPTASALEDLPPASLDMVVMLRVLTFRPEARDADLAYLRGIAALVKPGGRFVYHMDWVPDNGYREHLEGLMREAGFRGGVEEIPMPAHIPQTVTYYDAALVARPMMTLRRGFVLVFSK